jgi:hypothetical protein
VISSAEIWIPRRAPNLNDLFRAKSTVYGKGKVRTDAYAKLKEDWAATVFLCARSAGSPQFWRFSRCSVHFELVEPDKRRDPDNIASAASKLILDGLVKAGVLEGDGWAHITGLSFSWRVGSPAGVRVVLVPQAVTQREVRMEEGDVNGSA